MSTQHTTPPQSSQQYNSHHCSPRTLFPLIFPNQLAMTQSQMTLSWRTLTKKQLAQEMWTCKDPMCHTPHHQIPMGYLSTPSTSAAKDMKQCCLESSEPGSTTTLMPLYYMGVSPPQPEALDPSPHQHQTTLLARFVISSLSKDSIK